MLWKWRHKQGNYQNSGYDVVAFSPDFMNRKGWLDAGMTNPYWGKGDGWLTVDYIDTSKDFWALVNAHVPIAIMSFSRGDNDTSWELEEKARNLARNDWLVSLPWINDNGQVQQSEPFSPPHTGGSAVDFSPYKGQGAIAGNPPRPDVGCRQHSQ
ncbi:MAG: hypothetical protein WD894_11080 [Pirellulales bacterium]